MIFKRLLNWFRLLIIRYAGSPEKLQKAVRKAESLHKKNGKRYRVYFLSRQYQVLNRMQVQQKKHTGEWSRHVNMTRLEPMEFYDTENGYSPEGTALINPKSQIRNPK